MIRKDIEILRKLFLPTIEELSELAPLWKQSIHEEAFWGHLNTILFDDRATSDFLQELGVQEADRFRDRFSELRGEYISNLAGEYCSGATNPTIERLLSTSYKPFIDEVSFQRQLKQAITISELDHLKKKLSLLDARAVFEIEDEEIISAFELSQKKSGHDVIKAKMIDWDKKIPSHGNKPVVIPITNTSQSPQESPGPGRKAMPLTFITYAAAACFVGVMVWVGIQFYNQPIENNVIAHVPDTLKISPAAVLRPEFAHVEESATVVEVVKETGIGFATSQKKLKVNILIQDLAPRIQSIETYLNNAANDTTQAAFRAAAAHELDSLKQLVGSYTFDGASMQLFANRDSHGKNTIIKTADKQLYLTRGNDFYFIKNTPLPLKLTEITDNALKEKLERLIFEMK